MNFPRTGRDAMLPGGAQPRVGMTARTPAFRGKADPASVTARGPLAPKTGCAVATFRAKSIRRDALSSIYHGGGM